MTSANPKTIQIFLPTGEPAGIRMAEMTTRIVQVIDVPLNGLQAFFAMPESKQVAVYYLLALPDDGSLPQVYIGQTGDLRTRLAEHASKKDFWQRAVVLLSRAQSLTQTHAVFLEWLSIETARRLGRFAVLNGNAGSRPYTPAPMEADCREVFETGEILLNMLGYPLLSSPVAVHSGPANAAAPSVAADLFFCKAGGAEGRGVFTDEGLEVQAGSVGRRANVPSIQNTSDGAFRERLITDGVMKVEGETVVFTRDHLFRSPSTAAVALLGRTANGWLEWRNAAGQTLDAVKRQAISGAS